MRLWRPTVRPIPAERLVRRVKHLDGEHDIADLAGYSLDGHTVYIDRPNESSKRVAAK